ncbi:unnamed protein product, partial [Trichobilharzia regenti]
LSQIVKDCRDSIVRQIVLLLLVDAESDNPESSVTLFDIIYKALCTDDCDQISCIQTMFDEVLNHLESEALSDVSTVESCPTSALNSLRPLVNRLLTKFIDIYYPNSQPPNNMTVGLGNNRSVSVKERALFSPQRQPLMVMATWLSRYSITAQVCEFRLLFLVLQFFSLLDRFSFFMYVEPVKCIFVFLWWSILFS